MEEGASAQPPFEISAYVTTPWGKVIHKLRLVTMLNQGTALSNDRLMRIAEGTRYGDESAGPNAEMEGRGAIELSTRVFVSIFDKVTNSRHI
jgi:hypothetical protein